MNAKRYQKLQRVSRRRSKGRIGFDKLFYPEEEKKKSARISKQLFQRLTSKSGAAKESLLVMETRPRLRGSLKAISMLITSGTGYLTQEGRG